MRGRACLRALLLALMVLAVSASFDIGSDARAEEPPAAVEEPSTPAPKPDGPKTKDGVEITELRTKHSSSYLNPRGSYVTVVKTGSVNFKDAGGKWQPIDNDLVDSSAAGFAKENKANRYRLRLPARLGGAPVRVELGDAWLSFDLEGSVKNTVGVARAGTQTYADVFPGTSVAYSATADSVKETITLEDRSAPNEFEFTVRTSNGLSARMNERGGVDFVDGGGNSRFSFAPPWMRDSSKSSAGFSREVRFELAPAGGGYTVRMVASRAWLQSSARRYPVVIDPSMEFGGTQRECTISRLTPTRNDCGVSGLLDVGYDGSDVRRSLFKFDLGGIPSDAIMLDANFGLYLTSASTATAADLGVHRLLSTWDTLATWNTRDGSAAWATPGGEIFPEPAGAGPTSVAGTPGWYRWRITQMVQKEQNGEFGNFGFLLKQESETINNMLHFASTQDTAHLPQLRLEWEYPIGLRRHYTYESEQLTDRLDTSVNVATGNLVLNADDLGIAGTGIDLGIDRSFNSLALYNTNGGGELAWRWQMGTGVDIYMRFYEDGSAAYYGASGYAVPFVRRADGSYISPTAIDALLQKNADGSFTLMSKGDEGKQQFGANGRLNAIEDANGNKITFAYTATTVCCVGPWRLDSITDTQGRVTNLTYTAAGLLTQITDPAGRLYKYAYGTSGDLATYTDPAGKITRFVYSFWLITKITDPRGNVVKLAYDLTNRATSITRLLTPTATTGPKTTFTYNTKELGFAEPHTIVTDPNGNKVTYYYDEQSRVKKVLDGLGNNVTASFTENSDVATSTGGTLGSTTNTYDPSDNPLSSTAPTGASSSWQYGDATHPFYTTRATDAQGNATTVGYDTKGNLNAIQNAASSSASVTYNPNGTVATQTDFKGNVTSYGYDVKGNVTSVDHPAPLGDTAYTYDAVSRVATMRDGKGQTTTYAYDPLDRVTSITHGDSSVISYVYDGNGNATSMADNTGTTTYTYDALNRLTKETLPGPKTNDYAYDNGSRLISFTDAGGKVSYAYNAADLLTTTTEPSGKQITFSYDADHQRTATNYPNGVSMTMTFDSSNRLTRILGKKVASGLTLTDFVYTYTNSAGQDTGLRQSVTDKDGNKTGYAYDALNRLSSAQKRTSGGTLLESYAYSYDASSNRTGQTVNGVTTNYTHNAADQLTAAGSITYTYDANGNEAGNSAGRGFVYNGKDQTTSATPPGGSAISMSYTGSGQFRRVTGGGSSFTDSTLGLTRENTVSYTRDGAGILLAQRGGSGDHYYLLDGLGSVAALTDSAGNVAASYGYEPFGKLVSSTGTVANPWRFLGSLGVFHDTATGLYKMGTRYYDPALGRFTQTDSVKGGSANAYDYVFQNPVNMVDPSGKAGCTWLRDAGLNYNFGNACDAHDTCYGTWDKTRKQCDDLFKRIALNDCAGRFWLFKKSCNATAEIWYQNLRHLAVSDVARGRYRDGQFKSCPYKRNRPRCAALIGRRD